MGLSFFRVMVNGIGSFLSGNEYIQYCYKVIKCSLVLRSGFYLVEGVNQKVGFGLILEGFFNQEEGVWGERVLGRLSDGSKMFFQILQYFLGFIFSLFFVVEFVNINGKLI